MREDKPAAYRDRRPIMSKVLIVSGPHGVKYRVEFDRAGLKVNGRRE